MKNSFNAVVVELRAKDKKRSQQPPRRLKNFPVIDEPIENVSVESWRFRWHEEVLQRPDLARSQLAVAGVLMHRYNSSRGYAEVSIRYAAKHAGCSVDTALRAISELVRKGLIAIDQSSRRSMTKQRPTNRYRLIYASRGIP